MTATPDHNVPHIPELAADYEILRELGRGRRAVVYLAREHELGRLVGIEVLQPEYRADEAAAAALVREARTLGGLQHSGILTLYGTRRLGDGTVALIREYLPGHDLRSELEAGGPLAPARVHRILAAVAGALSYLHQRGQLHRSLRPEHVLVEDGTSHVRLTGFSSPPAFDRQAGAGMSREAMDAAAYLAPEQLAGQAEDARTDVFGLGVLGYELLTGRTPWPDADLFTIVEQRLGEPAPSPAALRPDVPAGLERAVTGALRSEPGDRWASAAAFLEALGEPPLAAAPAGASGPAGVVMVPEPGPAPGPWGALRGPNPGVRQHRRRAPRVLWGALLLAAAGLTWLVASGRLGSRDGGPAGGLWSSTDDDFPAAAPLGVERPAGLPDGTGASYGPLPSGPPGAAGAPSVAYVLSGDAQQGPVGDTLRQWLALRVEDASGRPVRGVAVRFALTRGDALVSPETSATDEYGVASARLLPRAPGAHEVQATVTGLDARPPVFRVVAVASADSVAAPTDSASGPRVAAVRPAVSAGGMHSCALDADGSASCWGGNDGGQLGDGSAQRRSSPTRVAAPEPLTSLSAGMAHSCGVGVSGSVYCWGTNSSGQLGDGTRSARTEPARVAGGVRLATLATGGAHSCGLDGAGRLYCWGRNSHGQLGDASRTDRPAPVSAGGQRAFRTLAVGWDHTCALTTSGAAFRWGRNHAGQVGDGSQSDRAEPTAVAGERRYTAIAAGSAHTCALAEGGAAWCWGQNAYGQLGKGDRESATAPTPVAGDESFRAITAGGVHSCALTAAGQARCWGRNSYGQLGDGSTQDRSAPAAVLGGLRFTSLNASGAHTCGTTTGGARYCWGYNLEGQLGDGTRTNQSRPVAVDSERQ